MINAEECRDGDDFEYKYREVIEQTDCASVGNDRIFAYKIAGEWYGWSAINISHYGLDNWEYLGKVKPCKVEYDWYEAV